LEQGANAPRRDKGRGKAHARGGEAANCAHGGVREGVSAREVGPRIEGASENKAQPLQVGLRVPELTFKLHLEGARCFIAPDGPPVDEFSFRNGERDVDWGGLSPER